MLLSRRIEDDEGKIMIDKKLVFFYKSYYVDGMCKEQIP